MPRRLRTLTILTICLGATGCASTAMRGDGMPIHGPHTWSQAPAPYQQPVAYSNPAAPSTTLAGLSDQPRGLSKYFPGLSRPLAESPKVATNRYRPTWFGLRPKIAAPANQVYSTDARVALNQPMPEPSASLPIAIQVPTDRPTSDRDVTPTVASVEPAAPKNPRSAVIGVVPAEEASPTVTQTGFGGTPSKPGEDEINPLPPAAEPGSPASQGRMPAMPEVNPTTRPVAPGPDSNPELDPKAVQAVPTVGGSPDPTVPASFATAAVAAETVGFKKHHPKAVVLASPQVQPSPQVRPTPQARPTPQVRPTAQVLPTAQTKPSPQGTLAETCDATAHDGHVKRCCIKKLFGKVGCKINDGMTSISHLAH